VCGGEEEMKCENCGAEMPEKAKTVIVDNVEYEVEETQKGKKYSEIKIPKGWRLWEPEESVKLYKDKKLRKKLNLEDCWFFVQSRCFLPKYVARFGADSDRAGLNCYGYPQDSGSGLGVRFCRDLKKVKKNENAT